MIPKIIHYCWFGGNPLPDLAIRCIKSWRRFFPDYEIKEWNEDNFALDCCEYVQEAYREEKWALVSDYARFLILYKFGGLYFDTDVEVIKSMEEIVERGAFMGCEPCLFSKKKDTFSTVNPGLALGAIPGLTLYKTILDSYHTAHLYERGTKREIKTVVERVTDILIQQGWNNQGKVIQHVSGIYIYPSDYFCPLNYTTNVLNITENTRSIHHYMASWHTPIQNIIHKIEKHFSNKGKQMYLMGRILNLPFRVVDQFQRNGVEGVFKALKKRM